MDAIKDSFDNVKKDMNSLQNEIFQLKNGLIEDRGKITEICDILNKLSDKTLSFQEEMMKQNNILNDLKKDLISIKETKEAKADTPTDTPTNRQTNTPTDTTKSPTLTTHITTLPQEIGGLKYENLTISTGNGGVPTDRQTHQQTHQQTQNSDESPQKTREISIDKAAEVLDSLDKIKKEIRLKFKRLTTQEMLIFSTLYQLEEEQGEVTYKDIARKLKLTESSIRDYVGRLINKGISVDKKKINNKQIKLSISENLKKIASLPTILKLREL